MGRSRKFSLVFSIHINKRDTYLLEKIQNFFNSVALAATYASFAGSRSRLGCEAGNIQTNTDGSITYSVTSIKDLLNIIIPHFSKFPLLTQKQLEHPFELFKQIVNLSFVSHIPAG